MEEEEEEEEESTYVSSRRRESTKLCCDFAVYITAIIMMLITILLMIDDRCNTSFAINACYVIIDDENGCKTHSVFYFNIDALLFISFTVSLCSFLK